MSNNHKLQGVWSTATPLKTIFIWPVLASNAKDDTLYVFGKNIALEQKLCIIMGFTCVFCKKFVNLHTQK